MRSQLSLFLFILYAENCYLPLIDRCFARGTFLCSSSLTAYCLFGWACFHVFTTVFPCDFNFLGLLFHLHLLRVLFWCYIVYVIHVVSMSSFMLKYPMSDVSSLRLMSVNAIKPLKCILQSMYCLDQLSIWSKMPSVLLDTIRKILSNSHLIICFSAVVPGTQKGRQQLCHWPDIWGVPTSCLHFLPYIRKVCA